MQMHTVFRFTLTLNLSRVATAHWSGLGRLFLISSLEEEIALSLKEKESDIGRQLVPKVSIILIRHGVFHRPFLILAPCTRMHA